MITRSYFYNASCMYAPGYQSWNSATFQIVSLFPLKPHEILVIAHKRACERLNQTDNVRIESLSRL